MNRSMPSQAVPAHLAHAHELVRRLGEPLLGGSLLKLFTVAEQAQHELLQSLHLARDHVNLDAGLLRLPDFGECLALALQDCCQRGVRVQLLARAADLHALRRELVMLRHAGATVGEARHAPGAWALLLERWLPALQRQLLVMDGRSAWVAPAPEDSPYPGTPPLYLNVQGPAVQRLQRLFVRSWRQSTRFDLPVARYFPPLALTGEARLGVTATEQWAQGHGEPHHALIGAVATARHNVRVSFTQGLPSRALMAALTHAAARGVNVTVLKDGAPLIPWAWRARSRELQAAGVRVHQSERAAMPQRRPVCVVDGVWSSVGVCNAADWRSRLAGAQVTLVALDAGAALSLSGLFDAALARSRLLTDEDTSAPAVPPHWLDQGQATAAARRPQG